MSLKDIKYVVGIDFGAVSSGVSIAHTEKPYVKYTVNKWEVKENLNTEGPKQFLTSILYKTDGTIICGLSNKASRDKEDVYINNIKQYIQNIDQANEELGERMEGLTIQKVVTDYLESFHALAIECLKKQAAFCKTDNFKEDFKLENIRYCLSCPKSQKDFMEECFVGAGIVVPEDLSYRLVCVTEVEASAYHCLSLDRIQSKIVHDQEYFVCDIGHSSFGMAKIQADTTELLSTVNLVSEEPGQGSMNLENNFRRYLNENISDLNLNQNLIDTLVEKFVDEIKYTFSVTRVGITEEEETEAEMGKKEEASNNDDEEYDEDEDYGYYEDETQEATETSISGLGVGEIQNLFDVQDVRGLPVNISDNDLDVYVFSPYIKYITDYIVQKDEDNKSEVKIFLSGNYSSDSYFYGKLATVNNRKFEKFLAFVDSTNGVDVVSLGAVSFGLRFHHLQTPFFRPKSRLTKEKEKNENKRMKKNLKKKENPIDFIVGIDFGTTFSGCSYADCRGADIHDNIPIKTLKTGWPGGDKVPFGKTPTLMMYDKKMKARYWGQAAKQRADSNPDLTLLGNFKLFLSPKSVANYYGVDNKDIKRLAYENSFSNTVLTEDRVRTSKTDQSKKYRTKKYHYYDTVDAVDVISDYLRVFNQHVTEKILDIEIRQDNGKNFKFLNLDIKEGFNIRYVLTVPAMWSASDKKTFVQASIDAGIITRDELHNLLVITEPEAAVLYCDKVYPGYVRDPEIPKAESAFVVCDAGGGTVDLATFKLEFEEDNKLKICQVGECSGDTCGSSYLDSKFKDYLLQFYKDMKVLADFSNTNFNSVMDRFINQIKVKFCGNTGRDGYSDFKLPTERVIVNVPEKGKKYILINSKTELRIKDTVMREEIFDPIVQNILDLIDKQIKQAEDNDIKIKSIVMIGGFSRNPYLQERVKKHYEPIYKVGIPPAGVTAISEGAVSYGLNPRMFFTNLADQSLALEVQAPFETKNENKNKEVLGPNGEKFARNRLEYFVKKMDYLHGDAYHRTVSVNYPQNVLIAIFSCDFIQEDVDDNKNWRYVSKKHNKIMEETIELPEVKGIKEGTNIQFDIFFRVDYIGVTVVIECLNSSINNEIKKMSSHKYASLKIEHKCNFVVFRNKKPLIQYSLKQSQFVFGSG